MRGSGLGEEHPGLLRPVRTSTEDHPTRCAATALILTFLQSTLLNTLPTRVSEKNELTGQDKRCLNCIEIVLDEMKIVRDKESRIVTRV